LNETEAIDKDVRGYQQKDDSVRTRKKRSVHSKNSHADQSPE
jgi:hypothetical protein